MNKNKLNTEDVEHNIGLVQKYICTTYVQLHLLVITLETVIVLFSTSDIEHQHTRLIFMISAIIFALLLYIAYYISKKMKQKLNALKITKVTLTKQIVYIGLSLLWMIIVTMVYGCIQIVIVVNRY